MTRNLYEFIIIIPMLLSMISDCISAEYVIISIKNDSRFIWIYVTYTNLTAPDLWLYFC